MYYRRSLYEHCKKILKGVIAIFLVLVVIGIVVGKDDTKKDNTQTATQTSSSTETKKTEDKAASTKAPEWNTSEMDAQKNGNIKIAAKLVKNDSNLAAKAETASAAEVIKRPWDYYGKVLKFEGTAAVLQDYPAGSDVGKILGGESCEVVMTIGNEETIVDGLLRGTTKGLSNGQRVVIYGYPVGISEVPNKVGGKFTHLVIVGVK